MMGYSLTDFGELFTYSGLSDYYSIDDALKLPEPQGRKFKQSVEISTNHITYDELNNFIDGDLSPISKALNNPNVEISFEQGDLPIKVFERWKRRFIKTLNQHEKSKLGPNARTSALKNRIVNQIESVMLDPINIINMLNPISMDNAKKAAKNTSLGNREKVMDYDAPTSMMIMQYQNMLGKNVIGSAASGLKAYFGELTYFNDITEEIYQQMLNGDSAQNIFENIKRIVFDGKYNSSDIRTLGNVPLRKLIRSFKSKPELKLLVLDDPTYNNDMQSHLSAYIDGNILNFEKLLLDLEATAWQYNISQNISEVLSAATDNAKELILAKINATLEFSDIYTYLITTGVSIGEIAKFMTSPIFNIVSRFAKQNIFNTTDRWHTLDKTIKFIKGDEELYYLKDYDKFLKEFTTTVDKKYISQINSSLIGTNRGKELLRLFPEVRTKFQTFLQNKCTEAKGRLGSKYNVFGDIDYSMDPTTLDGEDIPVLTKPTQYDEAVAIYNYVTNYVIPKYELLSELDFHQSVDQLNTLEVILKGVQEQKAVASFFSINKGIQTKDWDEYHWIEKQNNNINRIYLNSENVVWNENEPQKFDFVKFVSDDQYRDSQIKQFEKVKVTFNVLDAITKVDHFWEMLKLVEFNRSLINTATIFRFERDLEKELLGKTEMLDNTSTKSVHYDDWVELSNFTRDVITLNWFIRQPNLIINVPVGWKYYPNNSFNQRKPNEHKPEIDSNGNEINKPLPMSLNTQEGIATFKMIVENYIIPKLKSDPDFKDNMFIQQLRRDSYPDTEHQEFIRKYAFPFSLVNIEKGSTFEKLYNDIVKSFNRDMYKDVGSKFGIGNWSLGDLFFIYNLIVNKEGMGKSSMTKVFEDSINYGNEVKTAKSYYDYIKMIDSNKFKLEDLQYHIDDLKMRLANSRSARNYGVEINPNDKHINIWSKTGTYSMPLFNRNLSDFTFNMWRYGADEYEAPSELSGIKITDFDKLYEPSLDDNDVFGTIIDLMIERIGVKSKAPIQKVSTAELQIKMLNGDIIPSSQEDRSNLLNAKSFIHNGIVYINTDKARIDDPIHEFFHIICAGLKFNRRKAVREMYYKMLNDIYKVAAPDYLETLNKYYSNKHGSDRKEEVLVKALSDKFKNEFTSRWTGLIDNEHGSNQLYSHQLKSAIIETINETLGTSISEDIQEDTLGNITLLQALALFKSKLFDLDGDWLTKTSISNNQLVATIKDRLVKNDRLKIGENC